MKCHWNPTINVNDIGIYSDMDGHFVILDDTGEIYAPKGLDGYEKKSEAIEALGRIAGKFGKNESLPSNEVERICFDSTRS